MTRGEENEEMDAAAMITPAAHLNVLQTSPGLSSRVESLISLKTLLIPPSQNPSEDEEANTILGSVDKGDTSHPKEVPLPLKNKIVRVVLSLYIRGGNGLEKPWRNLLANFSKDLLHDRRDCETYCKEMTEVLQTFVDMRKKESVASLISVVDIIRLCVSSIATRNNDISTLENDANMISLITMHGNTLEEIGKRCDGKENKVARRMRLFLEPNKKEVPILIQLYMTVWTRQAQATFGVGVGLLSSLRNVDATTRNAILDYFMKSVLPSKVAPCEFLAHQYVSLLSSLSNEEWSELSTVLGKTIKKSPESASGIALVILQNVHVDMSRFVQDILLTTCGRMIKSADYKVRSKAIQIVKICAEKTSDAAVMSSLLLTFLDAYMGKVAGSSLNQAYQRVAVLHALDEVAKVLASAESINEYSSSVVSSVVKSTIAVAEKEADTNVKPYAFHCVAKWLNLSSSSGLNNMEFLKKGLEGGKSKGNFLLCIIEILKHARDEDNVSRELLSLVPSLKTIVNDAIKKTSPIGDADPIMAIRILLRMAVETPSVLQDISLEKVFSVGSFLCHPGNIALLQTSGNSGLDSNEVKYSIKDVLAESIVHIFAKSAMIGIKEAESVLFKCKKKNYSLKTDSHALVLGGEGEDMQCADMFLAAILFSSSAMLSSFTTTVQYLSTNCPLFIESIMHSFSKLIFTIEIKSSHPHRHDQPQEYLNTSFGLMKSVASPATMEGAASLLMGSGTQSSTENFINYLLIVCSKFVCCSGNRATTVFTKYAARSISETSKLVADEGLAEALTHCLASEAVAVQQKSAAAMSVLTSTLGEAAKVYLNTYVLQCLIQNIKSKEYLEYTEEQMDMFMHPDKIAALLAGPVVDASQITITNADRAGKRGKFGGDFQEDEEWIEQIKKDKLKKLQEAAKAKTSESTTKKIKDIQDCNAHISKAVQLLSSTMMGIQSFAKLNLIEKRNLSELLQSLMELTRLPIYCNAASETLICLCRPYFPFANDIAAALCTISTVVQKPLKRGENLQQRFKELMYLSAPIARVTKELHFNLARGKVFSEEMMLFVYPIIQGIFCMPSIPPDCDNAFLVLEMGWMSSFSSKSPSSLGQLKCAVLETCLKVLANFRVENSNPEKFFVWVMRNGSIEWAPFLSELGVLSSSTRVKLACLRAVQALMEDGLDVKSLISSALISLWLLRFDEDEGLATMTTTLWEEKNMSLTPAFKELLLPLLKHAESTVRGSSAKALIEGILIFPDFCTGVLASLKDIFLDALPTKALVEVCLPTLPASTDGDRGGKMMKISMSDAVGGASSKSSSKPVDTSFTTRHAVTLAFIELGLKKCITVDVESNVNYLLDFIVDVGVVDDDSTVQTAMLEAGRSVIDAYGQGVISTILAFLNSVINRKPSANEDMKKYDLRHEATVILLGAAGKHLSKDDPKILSITDSMLEALKTPSDSVQRAVADSLVGLVSVLKGSEVVEQQLEGMMKLTVEGGTYGDRRGAALGLAAYVKGLGIPCLKQHDIVTRLREICESGSVSNREGSLFAFECLSGRLGLLFEPYIIIIMPILLKSFSHSSDHVREAAQDAAKVIMAKLSAHGVKQVLTPLLTSLPTETAWKSRQEAIRLLGTMAYCAPRQLAACLPQIIPRLVDAVADPHPKVKDSAKTAMSDISSVIKNPEVASLSPILIAALGDPANKTKDALAALLNCEFMHSIDAPSLGILIPILGRALRDRSADLKRKSAAITGNICSMITDSKIVIPYFPQILPGLKECLVDPIPDVRATSAKALGSLMVGVGEVELSELVPWMMKTISSEVSPVERSGAAQGLAEIALSLNASRRLEILTSITSLQGSSKTAAREGMVWCLSFFPSVLGEQYAQYISFTLPIVLQGLCDDNDGVREVALRAGQVMVSVLGSNHTLELLPGLSEGLFDDDWRIRLCSVSLLGDLLYLVGDTRAAGVADVDDEMGSSGSSRASQAIRTHIGDECTNDVLAALYIARSDTSTGVRQGALQVWKTVVHNSAKTLKEVMPSLLDMLVEKLASPSAEMRATAGKALGDVVMRMGDQVLPVIVPQLQKSLTEDDQSKREGIALGLTEILNCSSATQIGAFVQYLVPALQQALCDVAVEVRQQAALAFQTMLKSVGEKAVAYVVSPLLVQINEEEEDGYKLQSMALHGLQEIVKLKPRELLEFLLPRLLKTPMTSTNAKILGFVAPSAGSQLYYHLNIIIPDIIPDLADTLEVDTEIETGKEEGKISLHDEVKNCASAIMGAVSTTGVNYLIDGIGEQIEDDKDPTRRRWGCWLLQQFIVSSTADFDDYICVFLKYLLGRVTDFNMDVLVATNAALTALTKKVPPETMVTNLDFIINCIQSSASEVKHRAGSEAQYNEIGDLILPFFTVPKALDSVLPVFLHGLMNGSATLRETAADGITELILLCEPVMLKPFLIKTTGPLIRVAGDRFPSSVKAAILRTLSVLLQKDVISLKAFAPQLQTTFVKSLGDPTKQVRSRAVTGLGLLMTVIARVDTLIGELALQFNQAEGNTIKTSILEAIGNVVIHGGKKLTAVGIDKAKAILLAALSEEDEMIRLAAGNCLKALSFFFSQDQVSSLISELTNARNIGIAGNALGCGAVVSATSESDTSSREMAFSIIKRSLQGSSALEKSSGCRAVGFIFKFPSEIGEMTEIKKAELISCVSEASTEFLELICNLGGDENVDVRKQAIVAIKNLSKDYHELAYNNIVKCMAPLVDAAKDVNVRIKNVADRAMKYLLQGGNLQEPINKYTSKVDSITAGFVKDYAKKVLSKLSDVSDDEEVGDFFML